MDQSSLTPLIPRTDQLHEVLRTVFGYHAFRGSQEDVIEQVIAGRDVLLIMPTGAGKSLCYQIPSLLRPGTGVVVSPLIALMQDQVRALTQYGIKAAALNSSLGAAQVCEVERKFSRGYWDLLYVSPERLLQERTQELLLQSPVALFAIDEAHCISQWGHDFRPEYLQLEMLARRFPNIPRIALTATADGRMQREIAQKLALRAPRIFVTGFDRPNIRYHIGQKSTPREQLLRFLRERHAQDAGIVYCMTRRKVEETAKWLNTEGHTALAYHAGLSAETRRLHQHRFQNEDGIVMVATIAFGMGIDKPDVRFVAHLDLPKSVESYYQETGRAGRDGAGADAWMIYGLQDVILLRHLVENSGADDMHKRGERQRLQAMLGLCEISTCRRQALLGYFGQRLEHPCGNCDTCLQPPQTWDGTVAAQKALSCVARTGERFGAHYLIDVLTGEENERIAHFGHHRLKTFGAGKDIGKGQWQSVFRQLAARGYVSTDREGHGSLILSPSAWPLLKGQERLTLRKDIAMPKKSRRRPLSAAPQDAPQDPLWQALRELRRQIAVQEGIAPFMVFHDSTLKQMHLLRPQTLEAMREISGVGDHKLSHYGKAFLHVIRGFNITHVLLLKG